MPEQPKEILQLSNLVLKMLEKVSAAKKQGLDEKTIAIQELKSESFHELVDMLLDIKDKYPFQYISSDNSFINSSLEIAIFRIFHYAQFIHDDKLDKKFIQLNGRNAYILFCEKSFKLEYIDIVLETFDKSFSSFNLNNYTAEMHIAHLALFANFVSATQELEAVLKYQILGFAHYRSSDKEAESRMKNQKEIDIILAEDRQVAQHTTFTPEDYEPYLQKMYIKRDFWYQNLLKLESLIKTELDNYLQANSSFSFLSQKKLVKTLSSIFEILDSMSFFEDYDSFLRELEKFYSAHHCLRREVVSEPMKIKGTSINLYENKEKLEKFFKNRKEIREKAVSCKNPLDKKQVEALLDFISQ